MAKVCNRRKILWLPGYGSLIDISSAEELGAEVVKIFPAEQVGGPKFVGMGYHLITKDIIANSKWDLLTTRVKETMAIIRKLKTE